MQNAEEVGARVTLEQIAGKAISQPDTAVADCAYYAVMNLYVRCGLEPPTIERMRAALEPADPDAGLTMLEVFALLGALDFPGLVCMGVIPPTLPARVIGGLMMAGWCLMVSVVVRATVGLGSNAGTEFITGHAAVPVACGEGGLHYLTTWPENPVEFISWEPVSDECVTASIGREFIMVMPKGEK